mmetsp:Transcript_53133/g.154627  ORF Transcript_53133/g.154627 Transcript_53133/m.154627 type:complete len:213 (-) Transcript_53133:608-1246(-)
MRCRHPLNLRHEQRLGLGFQRPGQRGCGGGLLQQDSGHLQPKGKGLVVHLHVECAGGTSAGVRAVRALPGHAPVRSQRGDEEDRPHALGPLCNVLGRMPESKRVRPGWAHPYAEAAPCPALPRHFPLFPLLPRAFPALCLRAHLPLRREDAGRSGCIQGVGDARRPLSLRWDPPPGHRQVQGGDGNRLVSLCGSSHEARREDGRARGIPCLR